MSHCLLNRLLQVVETATLQKVNMRGFHERVPLQRQFCLLVCKVSLKCWLLDHIQPVAAAHLAVEASCDCIARNSLTPAASMMCVRTYVMLGWPHLHLCAVGLSKWVCTYV